MILIDDLNRFKSVDLNHLHPGMYVCKYLSFYTEWSSRCNVSHSHSIKPYKSTLKPVQRHNIVLWYWMCLCTWLVVFLNYLGCLLF